MGSKPLRFCLVQILKIIYSEKVTKFCEIFTLLLSTVHRDKSKVKISQNLVAFSEYMNFNEHSCLFCKGKWYLLRNQKRLQKDFGPIARQTPLLTHVCFVYLVSNIYPNYLSMVSNLRKIILGGHFVNGKAPIA